MNPSRCCGSPAAGTSDVADALVSSAGELPSAEPAVETGARCVASPACQIASNEPELRGADDDRDRVVNEATKG